MKQWENQQRLKNYNKKIKNARTCIKSTPNNKINRSQTSQIYQDNSSIQSSCTKSIKKEASNAQGKLTKLLKKLFKFYLFNINKIKYFFIIKILQIIKIKIFITNK